MNKKIKKTTSFILSSTIACLLFICGCQPKINARGNITLFEKIDTFVENKTTLSEVYDACGTPSIQRGNSVWIYIGARSEEISFKKIEMKDKLVIRLTFNEKGILKKIEKLKGDNTNTPNEEKTGLVKK